MELQARLQVARRVKMVGNVKTYDYIVEYEEKPLCLLNFKRFSDFKFDMIDKSKDAIVLLVGRAVRRLSTKQKECINDLEKIILALETDDIDGSFIGYVKHDKLHERVMVVTDSAALQIYDVTNKNVANLKRNVTLSK